MKKEVIKCLACGWEHAEPDVTSIMPSGMIGAFSNPMELTRILREQRRERLATALTEHVKAMHTG